MNTKNTTPTSPNIGQSGAPIKSKDGESREQQSKAAQPAQKTADAGKHGASNMPPRGK